MILISSLYRKCPVIIKERRDHKVYLLEKGMRCVFRCCCAGKETRAVDLYTVGPAMH
jgi:hypothetical protein